MFQSPKRWGETEANPSNFIRHQEKSYQMLRVKMNYTGIFLSGLCGGFFMKFVIQSLRNRLMKFGNKLLKRIQTDFIFNNDLENINPVNNHFWNGSSPGKTGFKIDSNTKVRIGVDNLILEV